jgi:hypothetical protein
LVEPAVVEAETRDGRASHVEHEPAQMRKPDLHRLQAFEESAPVASPTTRKETIRKPSVSRENGGSSESGPWLSRLLRRTRETGSPSVSSMVCTAPAQASAVSAVKTFGKARTSASSQSMSLRQARQG